MMTGIADRRNRLVQRLRQFRAGRERSAQLDAQLTKLVAAVDQLRDEIKQQSTAVRAELEQLRTDLAEQASAVGAGLGDPDLTAQIAAAGRDVISEITAQVGFTFHDLDRRIGELEDRLEEFGPDRKTLKRC
jgi:small-conductance mechanosensitive channel